MFPLFVRDLSDIKFIYDTNCKKEKSAKYRL